MPNKEKDCASAPAANSRLPDSDAMFKVGEQYMVRRVDNTWRQYTRESKISHGFFRIPLSIDKEHRMSETSQDVSGALA